MNLDKKNKIAILGYGVEGKTLTDFFLKNGFENITIFDEQKNLEIENVNFVSGKIFGLENFDIVFRSPSILPTRPELQSAKKVSSLTQFFLELCSSKNIIGVTGTKGKGTTSSLIYETIKASGKKVFLGGNIGEPPLNFLSEISEDDFIVLELSSFQTMDLKISPNVAVILMTTSEHLDVHKDTNEYLEAKGNLIAHQNQTDVCFYNSDYENSVLISKFGNGKKINFSSKNVLEKFPNLKPSLRGDHNLENISAAMMVADEIGISHETQKQVFENFKGLQHRLEEVDKINDILFVNDSFSTTPETAIAAIKSFPDRKIVWLTGGSSKGSDFSIFKQVDDLKNFKKIILYGEEADKIQKELNVDFPIQNLGKTDLEKIWENVMQNIEPGDVVLLSPACASFDMFENYKKRGEWFRGKVNDFKNENN